MFQQAGWLSANIAIVIDLLAALPSRWQGQVSLHGQLLPRGDPGRLRGLIPLCELICQQTGECSGRCRSLMDELCVRVILSLPGFATKLMICLFQALAAVVSTV